MAHILVIDDDKHTRAMLPTALERAGHDVTEAADGRVGLRLFREEPADPVITDIFMPNKDGLETITELRRDFNEVKIIAVSGGGSFQPEMYLNMAEKLGAYKTFTKPLRLTTFYSWVQRFTTKPM